MQLRSVRCRLQKRLDTLVKDDNKNDFHTSAGPIQESVV